MNSIHDLFHKNLWKDISTLHTSEDIVSKLSFKQAMLVAYKLLYNDEWDENLQEFAVQLVYALRKKHPSEWESDWRYDAFLGDACNITLKYDERYEAYKNAVKKCPKPLPELLIKLAQFCYSPGSPPISYEDSIELLKQSIMDHPYKQAASLLKAIYSSKKDFQNECYWAEMHDRIKDENLPPLEPSFLIES